MSNKSVLVACECSQVVQSAFYEAGFNAWSCDIQDCYGKNPDRHIKGDAIEALYSKEWDLVIAHPPCTFLSNAGWWLLKGLPDDAPRYQDMLAAREFFYKFVDYGKQGHRICIENPVPHQLAQLPDPTIMVNPCDFGHDASKRTYLWLYNLPPIFPTCIGIPEYSWTAAHSSQRVRSHFWPGIAEAMVYYWGDLL